MMARRRLSPEEQAIWSKLAQTVSPLPGKKVLFPQEATTQRTTAAVSDSGRPRSENPPVPGKRMVRSVSARSTPVAVLDDSWERRIATGSIIPEMSVDLHGHSLESAHKRLNQALDAAVVRGVRVLLVVTGNPRPVSTTHGQKARGAIRAEIGDWLALSGHAEAIASVRTAHPRHGGRGALYIVLRRRK